MVPNYDKASGSLGQQSTGSLSSSRLMSITAAYSASLSASSNAGLSSHFSILLTFAGLRVVGLGFRV